MNKQQVEDDFNKFLEEEGLTGLYEWGSKWILTVLIGIIVFIWLLNKFLK